MHLMIRAKVRAVLLLLAALLWMPGLPVAGWAETVMAGEPLLPAATAATDESAREPVGIGTLLSAIENALFPEAPSQPASGEGGAVPVLRRARFRAAGDVMVHQRQLNCARGEDGIYDFHPQFERIAEALTDADYTIANLETTVGDLGAAYSGFPVFNSPDTLLDAMRDAGIDFLTLANNHILDRRMEGLRVTVDNVERLGFDHAGANRSPEERAAPVVAEVCGIRVGFMCYTEMTNGMENASREAREYGVNYLRDADFSADVKKLRDAGAEVIFALPHWGVEYRREPESGTVRTARALVAAGVDVVLGSHPHMVQPVEFLEVEGEDGLVRRGLVAYSLGNFISNQGKRYTDCGILLDFTLAERETGGFAVEDVRVIPTFCWRRDEVIQTLPALKYCDAPPEGMDDDALRRMRESVDDLRGLIDGSIPFIPE